MSFVTRFIPDFKTDCRPVITGTTLAMDVSLALSLATHIGENGLSASDGGLSYPSAHDCYIVGNRLAEQLVNMSTVDEAFRHDLGELARALCSPKPSPKMILETAYFVGLYVGNNPQ
ncbi:hypothetical protein ACTVH1_18980 [Gluconobacter cerinus]